VSIQNLKLSISQGFTLVEVIVALAIFSVIGFGSWQVLNQVLTTQKKLSEASTELSELQRGMWILANDFRRMVRRPIRNEYDQIEPALSTLQAGHPITFTRSGWENPLNQARSTLQRVAYRVDSIKEDTATPSNQSHLIRTFWPVLDRTNTTESFDQIVIPNVDHFEIDFIDTEGIPRSHWPPAGNKDISALPSGITVTITSQHFGDIERFFHLMDLEDDS
jgi:general secretion pathway protein J